MTDNMIREMDELTERATHWDSMRFSDNDAERLEYLRVAYTIWIAERIAIENETRA